MVTTAEPAVNLQFTYSSGLEIQWLTTSTLAIYPGQCRDSTNTFDIVLPAASSTTPYTVLNSALTGIGGIDIGAPLVTTSWYGVYVIADPQGFHPTGVIATNVYNLGTTTFFGGAPLLPHGYGIYRRIGWFGTLGGTNIVKFYQVGGPGIKIYQWDVPYEEITAHASSTTYVAAAFTGAPPSINQVNFPANVGTLLTGNAGVKRVRALVSYTPATAGNVLNLAPLGTSATATTGPVQITGPVVSTAFLSSVDIVTGANVTAGNGPLNGFNYASTSASDTLSVWTTGFEDYL